MASVGHGPVCAGLWMEPRSGTEMSGLILISPDAAKALRKMTDASGRPIFPNGMAIVPEPEAIEEEQ